MDMPAPRMLVNCWKDSKTVFKIRLTVYELRDSLVYVMDVLQYLEKLWISYGCNQRMDSWLHTAPVVISDRSTVSSLNHFIVQSCNWWSHSHNVTEFWQSLKTFLDINHDLHIFNISFLLKTRQIQKSCPLHRLIIDHVIVTQASKLYCDVFVFP